MLQYKKKAAAYMKALRKVCELLLTFKSEGKSEIIPENGNSFPQFIFMFYTILRSRCLVGVTRVGGLWKVGYDGDPNLTSWAVLDFRFQHLIEFRVR